MNKTLKELQNEFDVDGIYPSDAELHFALLKASGPEHTISDIFAAAMQWELDMIRKAMGDSKHPYFHMVSCDNQPHQMPTIWAEDVIQDIAFMNLNK
jgi:hypothetical protein